MEGNGRGEVGGDTGEGVGTYEGRHGGRLSSE